MTAEQAWQEHASTNMYQKVLPIERNAFIDGFTAALKRECDCGLLHLANPNPYCERCGGLIKEKP